MTLPDVRTLVPHAGRMVLLDRVVAAGAEELTAELTIRPDSQFGDGHGVGAWVGMEYMAQTVAAFAGHDGLRKGLPVKPGFLLGTRRYTCNVPLFPVGATLQVTARRELHGADGGLSSFSCRIVGSGIEAEANLAVFQPDDVSEFMMGPAT